MPLKFEEKTQKRLNTEGCKGCLYIANNGHLLSCALYRKWYNYNLEKINLKDAWQRRLKRDIKLKCLTL